MNGWMLKVSFETWQTLHTNPEWTMAHNREFQRLRRHFQSSDAPGFLGYQIGIGEVKLVFNTKSQADTFHAFLITRLPLLEDMMSVHKTVVFNDTYRLPYVIDVTGE
jgi:hypothetical protein